MYKIIAIMGKAGSGKDTVMHKVLEARPDLVEMISTTTRPPREGEIDGVNYHFVTPEQFAVKVLNNNMLEATTFNDWFYGTDFNNLRDEETHICVMNPTGVESLLADPRLKTKVFWVCADDKERLLRQLNRETNPDCHEIVRRFEADEIDFADIDFPAIKITNNSEKDLEYCVQVITASLEPPKDEFSKSINNKH